MPPICKPCRTPHLSPVCLAIVGLLLQGAAVTPSSAQTAETPDGALPGITVKAPKLKEGKAAIGGFGDEPEWQQPQQAERFSDQALKNAQIQRLGDLVKLDASVSASYNAAGYWDFLSVRGFVLDVAHNYRREGLPISGETSLPLDNKAAVEILKGTSGMQSGVSSPGGLLNVIVKRPNEPLRTAELAFTGHRGVLASVDLSERFGQGQAFGLRVNAAHEHLNTAIQHTRGERHLLAMAGDWRINTDTLLEAEMEHSRRSQRSVPGFSLLGTTVPVASSVNPKLNLNNQPWAQPVVMRGTTGTVRLTHKLDTDWKLTGTLGEQRLKSDDRTAFPFGADCSPDCRYSSVGTFDVYDFRSDKESRVTRAMDIGISGKAKTGSVSHDLGLGVMRSLTRVDVPTAAFTGVGTGDVSGNFSVPQGPVYDSAQNLRDERSTELYVRDSMRLSEAWRAWAGLRQTRLTRAQTPSDFSAATSRKSQDLTTPWLALGYEYAPQQQVYVSWGEGIEVPLAKFSTPFITYVNQGEVLQAMKSRQWEIGAKGQQGQMNWSLNYFRIVRPEASSLDEGVNKRFALDGNSRHQGIEGHLRTRIDAYSIDMSALWIDAERRGSAKPGNINGKAPANVPDYTLKMSHGYRVGALPGLTLQGDIVHEGPRTADVANDIRIPAWTRIDIGMAYVQQLSQNRAITWRAGVSNLLDTRAWVESPTQFDHIYLFPMAERTVTASMLIGF